MASQRLEDGALLGGRYEIEAAIGRGGMGAVYRARDSRLHCAVAVKELLDRYPSEEERAEAILQFEREARLLAQLSHPNLPRVSDYFVENSRCYLVMEFIDGETLDSALGANDGKGLGLFPALDWAVQLADALTYLHEQEPPIVFRDLKPANIMISADGAVKLIDFGIARRFQEGAARDTLMYGSPGYSPPEQYGRTQTDPRADIYALGATLHHVFTGRDPAPTPFKFPPVRKIDPSLPPALDSFIQRCVEMEEGLRIQTAREARSTLAAIRDEMRLRKEMFQQAAAASPSRLRGPLPIAAAAALVALLAILGGLWIKGQQVALAPAPPSQTSPRPDSPDVPAPPLSSAGRVRIESDISGAEVFIDGTPVGKTPLDLAEVPAGKHEIKVVPPKGSSRSEWSRNVEVLSGETLSLTAQLPQRAASVPPSPINTGVVELLDAGVAPVAAPNPQNAQPGLYFTVSFRIRGASGQAGSAAAFFYAADGKTPLQAGADAGPFRNSEGQLNVSNSIQVQSDPAEFRSLNLFIPESAFPVPYRQAAWRFVVHLEGRQIYQSNPAPVLAGQ